jgi:hypothetical protein
MYSCTHEAVDTRIAMFGSRLSLCRLCWGVVDPTPRLVSTGKPIKSDERVKKPAPIETASPKSLHPEPDPKASKLPEEFDLPLPRRRLFTSVFRSNNALLVSLLVLPFSLYATWFYLMYRPTFHEYTDPTQQYIALFPGQPMWTGGSAGGGSDGEVAREILGLSETYRIRVTSISEWQFSRIGLLNTQTLTEHMSVKGYTIIRPRPDVLIARASIEYELWINGKETVVGRIIVVDDLVYELTLRGSRLSLRDSRVQRFFNSFRIAPL